MSFRRWYENISGVDAEIHVRYWNGSSKTERHPCFCEQEDGRHHHHHNHNRRKTKPVICGIAHLIAKREAEGRTRRETSDEGRGLGVAGFLLGAFVGSKYQQHQYQYQHQPHPPPHPPQQQQQQQGGQQQQQQQQGSNNEDYDQVEDQGGGGISRPGGFRPGGGSTGGGGNHGGGNICSSLQHQNAQQYMGGIGSGSHFPILASILSNGGNGGNRIGQLPPSQNQPQLSQYQRPGPVQFSQYQRPAPVNEPQLQKPAPIQFQPQRPAVQQQNGFVNTYVRPWVDLFLK